MSSGRPVERSLTTPWTGILDWRKKMKEHVFFTDLDGTLLDARTYSFDAALPALGILRARHCPLVVCSSKTRAEIEHYRAKLANSDPFICENGGAIFIPRGYFSQETELPVPCEEDEKGGYSVIRLGARYRELRKAMVELREEGFDVRGFGDMTVEEIASATGLSETEAAMARMREFDEPFVFAGDKNSHEGLLAAIRAKGFNVTRGHFFHILGASDKGKAVSILIDMYRKEHSEIVTVALGDSLNDLPMLRCVDRPVIVEKDGGGYHPRFSTEAFDRAEGAGPVGWNKAVMKLLEEIDR